MIFFYVLTKLKSQMSFSDNVLSVVVCVFVNFSHVGLHNHRINFNETWHKSSLVKADSSLSNKGPSQIHRAIIKKAQK